MEPHEQQVELQSVRSSEERLRLQIHQLQKRLSDQSSEIEALRARVIAAQERATQAHAPIGIVEVTLDGHYVSVNDAFCELLGYARDELLGLTFSEITFAEDRARSQELVERLTTGAIPSSRVEQRFLRRDGTLVWVDVYRTLIKSDIGTPLYVMGAIVDLTDHKRAEAALRESEARYRLLFEGSAVPIWEEDFSAVAARFAELRAAGVSDFRAHLTADPVEVHRLATLVKILDVSPASLELFGVSSRQELLGNLPAYFREESWEVLREEMIALAHGQTSFRSEAPLRGARGEDRIVSLHLAVAPGAEHSLSRVLVATLDITERKAAEKLLLDAARTKDEFIAVLAHELRNPLAPVRTAAALLRAHGPANPLVARCAAVIDRQAAQMARLLDDLLDVSRLSRGKLILQHGPVVLQNVVEAAAETARPHIEQRQHQLVIDVPDTPILVDGDAARLTQVLGNLLNNAAKFTPPPGQISITARAENDEALVTVRDTGAGIASDQLKHIFDLFTQAGRDERTSSTGLGIGLALARQLVEMHGGSISVSSEGLGNGSEFAVRLPLTRVAASVPDDLAPMSSTALLGRRVVVVDDNADAAEMLATWLGGLGCEVRTVTDGIAAVQETERFRPDVAFVDLGMPGMAGYEVCRRIRQEPWGAHVTLVALTGWGQEEDRRRSISAGFDHHLVKPADLDRLVELLRCIIPGVGIGVGDGVRGACF